MMPAMAAAYAVLEHAAVPRATSALNVMQRVGGSVGTAALAVILQHELRASVGGAVGGGGALQKPPPGVQQKAAAALANAFGNTFWWAIAMSAAAIVPAILLVLSSRRERQRDADEKRALAQAA
jgi:hypothetical protein